MTYDASAGRPARSGGLADATHYDDPRYGDLRPVSSSRVSWGSIFAGTAVALVLLCALNLLGVGIGLATLNPASGDSPDASTLSIAAAIWYVVTAVISVVAGGWIAGRLSGKPRRSTGALHGLTSWAVTTLVVVYFLTTAIGGLFGGAFGALGSAIGGVAGSAGGAAAAAAPALAKAPDPFAAIADQIQTPGSENDPKALRDAAVAAVKAAVTGDAQQADAANEKAAQALAKAENVPVDQARQQVRKFEDQYKQTVAAGKKKAAEAAQVAVKSASRGAILAFAALLLGAIASALAGAAGTLRGRADADPLA